MLNPNKHEILNEGLRCVTPDGYGLVTRVITDFGKIIAYQVKLDKKSNLNLYSPVYVRNLPS